jgi:hypothetical protein
LRRVNNIDFAVGLEDDPGGIAATGPIQADNAATENPAMASHLGRLRAADRDAHRNFNGAAAAGGVDDVHAHLNGTLTLQRAASGNSVFVVYRGATMAACFLAAGLVDHVALFLDHRSSRDGHDFSLLSSGLCRERSDDHCRRHEQKIPYAKL